MMKLILVISLVGLLGYSGAQIVQDGQCRNVQLKENFNADKFAGTWYEIRRSASPTLGECATVDISKDNGYSYSFTYNSVKRNLAQQSNAVGKLEDGTAKFTLKNLDYNNEGSDFWIVATDYESYALAYSCENISPSQRSVSVWQMGRQPVDNDRTRSVIRNSLTDLEIDISDLPTVEYSSQACFDLLMTGPGRQDEEVILSGQCEDNKIEAMPNLDVARFTGRWFNIWSFYDPSSQGTCGTANYRLQDDGLVGVVNSEVIDQNKREIKGTAGVISDDGSGVLNVTLEIFPGFEVSQNLWIVATDYDNWGISMSCRNVDSSTKRLGCWKISRTKSLSQAAEDAINEVIARNPDLAMSSDKFILNNHTEAGCYYVPEATGERVVFPGKCEANAPVLSNFDMARFTGIWNEIEAYPKEQQTGQCINHEFTTGFDNTLNLRSTSVSNQYLEVTNGVLSYSSNDNSGRLYLDFVSSAGIPIRINYWIIDTDYTNYALIYSCEDIDDYFRAVYGWKLSRAKELSAAAITAINNAMSNNDALDNKFYETIDQSPGACQFTPRPSPSEPVIFPGQCPTDIPVVTNFAPTRYVGRWNLIESYPSAFQDGQCNQATYTAQPDGSVLVENTQVKNEKLDAIIGNATLVESNDGSGKLLVVFPDAPPLEYWILATDYDSYSFIMSCRNLNEYQHQVWSWKMSRTTSLSNEAVTVINQIMNSVDELDSSFYQIVDTSDKACFYKPEPNGLPVEFRGQCAMDIEVVQNFDVERYQGRWYEIEKYPQQFQKGSCGTANYLIVDGVVQVENTQVENERLDVIGATAVPEFNDGSAKLLVTFPVAGTDQTVTTQYWVLATDYDNYALVYSCQNIDSEKRRVTSWKLSRSKELTQEAERVINNKIDEIDVMDQQYFEKAGQSNNDCFYYPEFNELPSVIELPGWCPNDIKAVENFDAPAYLGTWYEMKRYPTRDQFGGCPKAEYSLGDGVVNVFNTQVVDEELLVQEGYAFVASDDGTGLLEVIFNVNGVTVNANYYVLATDYSSYALVYSCRNTTEGNRLVSSWRLSRDPKSDFSDEAEEVMKDLIEKTQGLREEYYTLASQSDEACFYYPKFEDLPNSIELPGNCPDYIRAKEDFDAAAYLGRWYEVERYPTRDQWGGCPIAEYSLGDGVVNVYNTQVDNEELLVQEGTAIVASDDGTGLLNVTFVVNGVTVYANYYVMETDYISYAIVYSCRDTLDGKRTVSSWKLSRNQFGLSNEANEAIKEIIAKTQGLREEYYITTNLSNDACFYYPKFEELPNTIELRGYCPENIQAKPDFNAAAYLGKWYEVERYPTGDQWGGCPKAEYSLGDGGVVNVYNTQVDNEELLVQEGYAVVASDDGSGKLDVTFVVNGVTVNANYYVIATDYDNYALVYSCRNTTEGNRLVSSWKLSRRPTGLSVQANAVIDEFVNKIQGLRQEYYTLASQSEKDCFYYPKYDELPSTIVLPGLCPEDIKAKADFNAARYLGRWYEIARLPTGDEFGECARAEYNLGDDVVEVLNTQVVNEELLVQEGYAVVASDDGTGLLNVTFVVNGVTLYANYYVMETDYDTYAIVYSCRNTADGNSIVSSWKLSRNKSELSAEAKEIIEDVVNNTRGLKEEYYITTSQTDVDCFHVPEMEESKDVVYVGKCESITGVQNFNIERYTGWWHEIERFPRAARPGECTTSEFQRSGNQYLVVDTSVTDQNGEIETSTVTATSNGMLRRTFSNGRVVDTWVLATDYETYSLLYSCEDFVGEDNNDYRRVWSAKHSRSRQLTNAAQNAMAQVIQSNRVLYPQFYVPVDQSDNACFYYPEPSTRPVVFRGQCDESIPLVQNFQAGEYTGTWYQIEKYPQTFEASTECTGARYSLDESTGVVTLVNWEVINNELDTITGNATISSTDGSAKLLVVLPNRGESDAPTVTYTLYVLRTDYISYALAYSCVNINEYQRQVGVWKLSRTRRMPPAGDTAINDFMVTRPELNQQYFLRTNHYDGCLEPSSSGVLFKSSIVLLLVGTLAQLLL